MSNMTAFFSGISLGLGTIMVVRGIRSGDLQLEALGGIIMALAAIAWAIIGLKG